MPSNINLYTDSIGNQISIPIISYSSQYLGPKIILTCLNHGDEVIGLEAALQVLEKVKLDQTFCGSMQILSCMNFEGFARSSRNFEAEHLNSTSSQNLNRNFGNSGSTLTSLVGSKILNYILEQNPDLVLDLHSYAQNSLVHTIVDRPGGDLEKQLVEMCQKSQVPFYLEYETETLLEQKLDYSLSNQLCINGIRALTVELGPKKSFSILQSQAASQAILNFVSANHSSKNEIKNLSQGSELNPNLVYQRDQILNNSEFSGYFRPLIEVGKYVQANQIIAQVVNLKGQVVHEVLMPKGGVIVVWEDEAVCYPRRPIGVFLKTN